MGKAILFIFIFAVITSVVMLNFSRGNIVRRQPAQPPQPLSSIEEAERHDSGEGRQPVENSEQLQPTAKPVVVPTREAKALLPEGWKRVLIVIDIILNLWMLIRFGKVFNTGGDEVSQRFNWVTANDKKFYMHATKRQTGEWKPATIGDLLGATIFVNGLLLLIAVVVNGMLLHFLQIKGLFEAYSLLLIIGGSAILAYFRE